MIEPSNNSKWDFILEKLITCQNDIEKEHLIYKLIQRDNTSVLSFINAHAANLILRNERFRQSLMDSEFLIRDGSGMHLLLSLIKVAPGLNLNGTDLIPEILRAMNKNSVIAVYGTQGDHLKEGVQAIKNLGFSSVFSEDGFQTQRYYLKKFIKQEPDLVILAMGMPKQEILSAALKEISPRDKRVLIINGGGIIDFMSGKVKRSPKFMRKLGIEWLYRLSLDPKRLWKRNLGSVLFILRTLKYKITTTRR